MRLLFLTCLLLCLTNPFVNGMKLRTAIRNGQKISTGVDDTQEISSDTTNTNMVQTQGGFSSPVGTISMGRGVLFRTDSTGKLYHMVVTTNPTPYPNYPYTPTTTNTWVNIPTDPFLLSQVSYDANYNTICGVSQVNAAVPSPTVYCNRGSNSLINNYNTVTSWASFNLTSGVIPTQVITRNGYVVVLDNDENIWYVRYALNTGLQMGTFTQMTGPEIVQLSIESGNAGLIMCGIAKTTGYVLCHDNGFTTTPSWRVMVGASSLVATGSHVVVCNEQTLLLVSKYNPSNPQSAVISSSYYSRGNPEVRFNPMILSTGNIPIQQVTCDVQNSNFVTLGQISNINSQPYIFTGPTPDYKVPVTRV